MHSGDPLPCEGSEVTSFVISNSASLLSSFAADLATPLEPVFRGVALMHVVAVYWLPLSSFAVICLVDFLLLPPKALLTCLFVVLVTLLWDELQVALMMAALITGIWSLQRLWKLFVAQWTNRFFLTLVVQSQLNRRLFEQSEWIRGVVVSTLARVQHLPVASTPLFLQAEVVVLYRAAMEGARRATQREALVTCVRVLRALEAKHIHLLLQCREKLLQEGALAGVGELLGGEGGGAEGGAGGGEGEEQEAQRSAIDLLSLLLPHPDAPDQGHAEQREPLLRKLLALVARHRSDAPQMAAAACAAIASLCTSSSHTPSPDREGGKAVYLAAARVLREAARGPAALHVQLLAARALLNLSQAALALSSSASSHREDASDEDEEAAGRDGEETVSLFLELLARAPPPLCHLAAQFFRLHLRHPHRPTSAFALDRGLLPLLLSLLRTSGEPAVVWEALGCVSALAASAAPPLLKALRADPSALPSLQRLLVHQEGRIRRHALVSLLYLTGRLSARQVGEGEGEGGVGEGKEEERCSICWSEYAGGGWVAALPDCRHRFHLHCINTWLLGQPADLTCNPDCPLCKGPVTLLSLSSSS